MSDCKSCEYEAEKWTGTEQGRSGPKKVCARSLEMGTEDCLGYGEWPPDSLTAAEAFAPEIEQSGDQPWTEEATE